MGGGTCRILACHQSRGAVCQGNKCMCPYGECTVGGMCVHQGGGYHGGGYHRKQYGGGAAWYAVDGHRCEYGWSAFFRGRHLVCHTYCCYTRNRYGRRSYNSYCRVWEYGRQVLKQCRHPYMSLSEEEEDGDATSEEGLETMTLAVAAFAGGSIAMLAAWAALRKKRSVPEEPLLA